MRYVVIGLILILFGLQFKLWFGNDSIIKWIHTGKSLEQKKAQNESLRSRNKLLEEDIAELKSGERAIEEHARHELGMVKQGETYYHFVN